MTLVAKDKCRMVTKLAGGLEGASSCEQLIIPGAGEPADGTDREARAHTGPPGALIP